MPGPGETRRTPALMGALIAIAAIAAYSNSLAVPFLFDDTPSILQNPTIRHLGAIGTVLSPSGAAGATTSGRPMLNLSLAVSFAVSGAHVWSYHALNLLVHILAGLTLFGLVRRTLERARIGPSHWLAFAIALIWTVHPLQTESVTYIVQRAESLAGLFYLLTLYCFARYTAKQSSFVPLRGTSADEEAGGGVWALLSISCCLLGMATKETMVTAPVVVFLYDRTFVSGSFGEAWRRHRRVYFGLAATWLLLVWLVLGTGGNRGGSIGFGVGIPWWKYALSQFQAVARYLRLSLWPHPLIFDYGTEWARGAGDVLPYALIVGLLASGTTWALLCPAKQGFGRQALGFAGAWFFIILAPTSSIVPGIRQTTVEHRMYLPLAAVIAIAVCGLGQWVRRAGAGRLARGALLAGAAACCGLTFARNHDYRTELALWTDTVEKLPANGYAHYNLGVVLLQEGRPADAIREYRAAIRIEPRYAEAHNNLGVALLGAGRNDEAIAEYERALDIRPRFAEAHNNLGNALAEAGRLPEAAAQLEEALRIQPDYPEAHLNLGIVLEQLGRLPEAIGHYERALRLQPEYSDAHDDLGNALREEGRLPEAIEHYRQSLRLAPEHADVHNNLGDALAEAGWLPEAIAQYGEAIRLRPGYAQAHESVANALVRSGRAAEAVPEYEAALKLVPDNAEAHNNLGGAFAQLGRLAEAGLQFETALRLKPDYADARKNLQQLRGLERLPRP